MQRPMTRVYVLYTQEQERPLVHALQKLGVLHIEPVRSESPALGSRDFSHERQELENLLLKVKGLCEVLVLSGQHTRAPSPSLEELSSLRDSLQELEEQVRPLIIERRAVQEQLDAATRLKDVLEATEILLAELLPHQGREVIVGLGSGEVSAEAMAQFLQAQLPLSCTVRSGPLPQDRHVFVVSVDAEYAPIVREYLEAKGIRPVAWPAHIPGTLTLPETIAQLKRDLSDAPARLAQIDGELRRLGQAHGDWLLALGRALENRIAQMDAMARFGYTDYTLLISGWIPSDEYENFVRALREKFPEIIVREDALAAEPEEIPVALKNNAFTRPYELFLSIMGVPKYGAVDPVPFVSFFFPLFFGIIIGDMGYGAVIGALGLWLRRAHSELVRQASQIVLHCALVTIFFGAVFAELFGFTLPYPHFKRGEQTTELLLFCAALGATQILLGFVLGAINALREKHKKHALAKLAAIGALGGLGLTVGVLAGQLPPALKTPSSLLLAVALVLLVLSEGIMGILELVSYVGNIISYARLMGFGLVGLKIAELINEAGHELQNIFLAVLLGIVGHAANLGLALFESTVQSARLHYVEFFQKFLELGGRKYEPFREI